MSGWCCRPRSPRKRWCSTWPDAERIDAAEGGLEDFDRPDELLLVAHANTQRGRIHPAEHLEQQRLTLHDGKSRFGSDVAQAEHTTSIGDDRNGVAPIGLLPDALRLRDDGVARSGHTGRVP